MFRNRPMVAATLAIALAGCGQAATGPTAAPTTSAVVPTAAAPAPLPSLKLVATVADTTGASEVLATDDAVWALIHETALVVRIDPATNKITGNVQLAPGYAYRLGLATSRAQARQLVRHGHLTVNGRKVDIPSFSVKPGDVVTVRQSSHKVPAILHALEEVKGRGVPEWLSFDAEGMSAKVGSVPTREQINLPVQEQLIVELYSK